MEEIKENVDSDDEDEFLDLLLKQEQHQPPEVGCKDWLEASDDEDEDDIPAGYYILCKIKNKFSELKNKPVFFL